MSRQRGLDVFYLAGGDVVLEHRKDGARGVLRIDRLDVIQFGCNLREELVFVAQPFGFAGRVMPLVIIEPANQNRQLGPESRVELPRRA